MEICEIIAENAEYCKKKYDEAEDLLLSPEITADVNETRKFSIKKGFYGDVLSVERRSLDLYSRISNNKKELAETLDEEYKFLLKEEITSLGKELKENCLSLSEILFGKKSCYVKIDASASNGKKILSAYEKFANDLRFSVTKGDGLLIYGNAEMMLTANAKYIFSNNSCELIAYEYISQEKTVLNEKDVRTDIYLSHGKGGQNINKVETAVRLTYLPLNIVVTCQDERSQLENKKRAYEKLEKCVSEEVSRFREKANKEARYRAQRTLSERIRRIDEDENTLSDSYISAEVVASEFLNGDLSMLTAATLIKKAKDSNIL